MSEQKDLLDLESLIYTYYITVRSDTLFFV